MTRGHTDLWKECGRSKFRPPETFLWWNYHNVQPAFLRKLGVSSDCIDVCIAFTAAKFGTSRRLSRKSKTNNFRLCGGSDVFQPSDGLWEFHVLCNVTVFLPF